MNSYKFSYESSFSIKMLLKMLFLFFITIITIFLSFSSIYAGVEQLNSNNNDIVKTTAKIFTHKSKSYLAVYFKNKEEWFTYWKNPGDAGIPLQHLFNIGTENIVLKEIEWPRPLQFSKGAGLVSYGYTGTYAIFFELDDLTVKKIENKVLTITSKWLACKENCIPGKSIISGKLQKDFFILTKPSEFQISEQKEQELFLSIPENIKITNVENLKYILVKDSNRAYFLYAKLYLNQSIGKENFKNSDNKDLLIPFPKEQIYFKHQQKILPANSDTVLVKIPMELDDPSINSSIFYNLKFLYNNPVSSESKIIELKFDHFENEEAANKFISANIPQNKSSQFKIKEIFLNIFLAFIGGIILNFMPCVLPVILFKLFALVKYNENENENENKNENKLNIKKHNFFYIMGTISTFLLFALIAIILKMLGESVGLGFHMQSPLFMFFLTTILLLFAINFFGVFDFKQFSWVNNLLSKNNFKNFYFSDFFDGILATLLSTPCSAPFIGTALAFAFVSPAYIVFLIFLFMGIGFSFPFIIISSFPSLYNLLPKPGNWIFYFKKILGITLFLTACWTFYIFISLIDVTTFFKSSSISSSVSSSIEEKWSNEALQKSLARKQAVFFYFTAKWCITCKANEVFVIETKSFQDIIKKYDMKILRGDWTTKDKEISKWFKKHNVPGVPANFIQQSDGTLVNIGEILTSEKVENIIKLSEK
ncbi:MAG: thioredoxin family protein [Oligoflexia bacterium]|nr:thioredoxin family protein [Oligoflexia bacterium]